MVGERWIAEARKSTPGTVTSRLSVASGLDFGNYLYFVLYKTVIIISIKKSSSRCCFVFTLLSVDRDTASTTRQKQRHLPKIPRNECNRHVCKNKNNSEQLEHMFQGIWCSSWPFTQPLFKIIKRKELASALLGVHKTGYESTSSQSQ